MKKIFNLAVAMSVIASSLFFASCGEDEDEEEPQQQTTPTNNNQNNNNDNNQNNNNKNNATAETSVTVKAGETYTIANSKVSATTTMSIDKVEGTTVTLTISGLGTVTVGTGSEDKSYAIVSNEGKLEAVSKADAEANPANVLLICNGTAKLSSGTLAKSSKINSAAGETTFTKQ